MAAVGPSLSLTFERIEPAEAIGGAHPPLYDREKLNCPTLVFSIANGNANANTNANLSSMSVNYRVRLTDGRQAMYEKVAGRSSGPQRNVYGCLVLLYQKCIPYDMFLCTFVGHACEGENAVDDSANRAINQPFDRSTYQAIISVSEFRWAVVVAVVEKTFRLSR